MDSSETNKYSDILSKLHEEVCMIFEDVKEVENEIQLVTSYHL